MSEMVERVAAAVEGIIEARGGLLGKGSAELAARAAIEAMREPSGNMVEEGCGQWWNTAPAMRPGIETVGERMAIIWRSMIDAALK